MTFNYGLFFLALLPIITVLVLMIGFKWSGARAGAAGWLSALVIAVLFFGTGAEVLAYSQTKGLLLSVYVLYVIWMALILYNIVQQSGAIDQIGKGISKITSDRVLQLLILSWVFSSFLQGIAGYGIPIAIVAPLLIGLGFSPITSVTAVAVGHAWSVTFGSIAASFNAVIATSGLAGEVLAPWSAILLGIVCLLCGFFAAHSYEKSKSVRSGLFFIIIIGLIMAGVQYFMAVNGMWNIAAFTAGLVGLVASILVVRFVKNARTTEKGQTEPAENGTTKSPMPYGFAFGPYIVLILVVMAAELIPALGSFLDTVKLTVSIPETSTMLGWVNQAGKAQVISIFGHPGALLIYASIISYFIFRKKGYLKKGSYKSILQKTVSGGLNSSIGIITMVGFAMIMEASGMTNTIAVGLSHLVGAAYPLVSPFVGLLGSFMTGSNTNSNIVFVPLQKQTAELLKISVPLILAAQTAGGSIGGMLAPARIIVGCSTAGLTGQESKVLAKTITYGLIMTAIIGVIVFFLIRMSVNNV